MRFLTSDMRYPEPRSSRSTPENVVPSQVNDNAATWGPDSDEPRSNFARTQPFTPFSANSEMLPTFHVARFFSVHLVTHSRLTHNGAAVARYTWRHTHIWHNTHVWHTTEQQLLCTPGDTLMFDTQQSSSRSVHLVTHSRWTHNSTAVARYTCILFICISMTT